MGMFFPSINLTFPFTLIHMIAVHSMKMAVMFIIDVVAMLDGLVAAIFTMFVFVILVWIAGFALFVLASHCRFHIIFFLGPFLAFS